ncbi:MAG: molybdenum cofactor guanylyltransferase [Candidatus Bathyarchaeota archaeon]|nr:molybdenum cofactor guanylyltransferase [Candidatus Termiticorpusculum sp.]
MLDKSAIILAGGTSKGFPEDKGTILLDNKPLIRRAFDIVDPIVDEVIIVTNTQERVDKYAKLLPETAKFAIDKQSMQGPLIGAITGFETAQGKYTLLMPYDSPFVNEELAMLLLDLAVGKTAAVPRNPNNEIEPLCSVYQTKSVLETAKQVAAEGAVDLQTLVENLLGVRYISTLVIEQIDPDLRSFFSVNTPLDLKRAAVMLQGRPKTSKTKR